MSSFHSTDPGSTPLPPSGSNKQRQPFGTYRFGSSFTPRVGSNGNGKHSLTVSDIINWYLEHAKNELAPSTYKSEKAIQLAFARDLGALRISEAKPYHLKDWVVAKKTWKSGATRQSSTARIRAAFGAASRMGKIDRDPFKGVTFRSNECRRPITTEEHQRAKSVCKDENFRDMLDFYWLTGVRPDEIVSLEWVWVHMDAGFISMPEHKTAKRTCAPRDLVITKAIREILDRAKARKPGNPLVFSTATGRAWKVSNSLRTKWQRIRDKGQIEEDAKMYGYRHSVATRMLSAGIPDTVVAKCLGHSDVRMLKRYAHPQFKDLTNAFERAAETPL